LASGNDERLAGIDMHEMGHQPGQCARAITGKNALRINEATPRMLNLAECEGSAREHEQFLDAYLDRHIRTREGRVRSCINATPL